MTSAAVDRRTGLKSSAAFKGPCKVATTGNIVLSGEQAIDGVSVRDGDRVLVRAQSDARENGIWIASTGNWIRSPDFRDNNDLAKGTQVIVTGGTYEGIVFRLETEDPIDIGTSEIVFVQMTTPVVMEYDDIATAPILVQKQLMEVNTGFNNGVDPSTEAYPGASYAVQGYKRRRQNGVDYAYLAHRTVPGSGNYQDDERGRYAKVPLKTDGSLGDVLYYSDVVNCGHMQDAGVFERNGITYLVSFFPVSSGHSGEDAGKGVSITRWRDGVEQTTNADVQGYQLFGYNGSGHDFEMYHHFTASCSSDGEKIVGVAQSTIDGGRTYFEYNTDDILTAGDTLALRPDVKWRISSVPTIQNLALQGVDVDDRFVYFTWGYLHPFGDQCIQVYDRYTGGDPVRTILTEHVKVVYGRELMMNNPTLGYPAQIELEAGCIFEKRFSFVVLDTWRSFTGASVVDFAGKTFACINSTDANGGSGLSVSARSPHNPKVWVQVDYPANRGSWNPATSDYTMGKITRRSKLIWEIGIPTGDECEMQLVAGVNHMPGDASLKSRSNVPDMLWPYDDTMQGWSYSEGSETYFREFEWAENGFRFFDSRPLSDNTNYARLYPSFDTGREFLSVIGGKGNTSAAHINIYGNTTETLFTNMIRAFSAGPVEQFRITPTYSQFYLPDTGYALKHSRAGTVYGGTWISTLRHQLVAIGGTELTLSTAALDSDTPTPRWVTGTDGVFYPYVDATYNFGKSGARINNSYFAVAPTVTSDMAEKDNFRSFTTLEREAFLACAGLLQLYQLKSAIAEKGVKNARLHPGVPAQLCIAEFESRGLDPWRYGCFGRDQKMQMVESSEPILVPIMEDVPVDTYEVTMIDGVAVRSKVVVIEKRQKATTHLVFDEEGRPVLNHAVRKNPVTGETVVDTWQQEYQELMFEEATEPQFHLAAVEGEWTYSIRYTELYAGIIAAMLQA